MNTDSESGLYRSVVQLNSRFQKISNWFSKTTGQPLTFAIAVFMVIVWGMTGFKWGFSIEHQLFINTITTIVTFLMIFLLQGSQNSDTADIKAKLNRILESDENRNPKLD